MNLYIARHGESMANLNPALPLEHDHQNTLSPQGRQQATQLAERLISLDIDVVYCSPLHRAMETAVEYLRRANQRAEIWPWLAEANAHITNRDTEQPSGRPQTYDIPVAWSAWLQMNGSQQPAAEDETFEEGLQRMALVKDELLARHGGGDESVLVIAHGFVGSALMEHFLDVPAICRFSFSNTGLSLLQPRGDNAYQVKFANRLS